MVRAKSREPRQAVPFNPFVGKYASRLRSITSKLVTDPASVEQELEAQLTNLGATGQSDHDAQRFLFVCSVLIDFIKGGGTALKRDSQLMLQWPDWEGPSGRAAARKAMIAANELRTLREDELERVRPMFAADAAGEAVAQALAEGSVSLYPVEEHHPSGIRYAEGFSAALRLWSMPYRGRQGRMRRFVVTCQHAAIGEWPVIAGLIELGDEAPFCPWRDELVGLEIKSFLRWFSGKDDKQVVTESIHGYFHQFRKALLGVPGYRGLARFSAEDLVNRRKDLERKASGRSITGTESQYKKRMSYALRLARGELSMVALGSGMEPTQETLAHLSAGIRAVHDIVLPRVHMEATICGAVPPFSTGLGGKLVVSMLAHPEVLAISSQSESTVLEQSFHRSRIDELLPQHGMLALTTKGLYAQHSPMYHRSTLPGEHKPVPLERITTTGGSTTTLSSFRTGRLAWELVRAAQAAGGARGVSADYGTGGAKRHRAIELAARLSGVDHDVVSPGIRRPVYAARFVDNAEDVVWLRTAPKWRVRRDISASGYCEAAFRGWREQWLPTAASRLSEYAYLPSPIRILGASHGP